MKDLRRFAEFLAGLCILAVMVVFGPIAHESAIEWYQTLTPNFLHHAIFFGVTSMSLLAVAVSAFFWVISVGMDIQNSLGKRSES